MILVGLYILEIFANFRIPGLHHDDGKSAYVRSYSDRKTIKRYKFIQGEGQREARKSLARYICSSSSFLVRSHMLLMLL